MLEKLENKSHYNIYYIFKDDKEKNSLEKIKALALWNNISKAIKKN